MRKRVTAIIVAATLAYSLPQPASAADIVTGVTRDQVATILRDAGYRAEVVADQASSTGPYIRTGIGGHTALVGFFNCTGETCAAIQFWSGFKKSPKFTPALVERWNNNIRYAKLHLTNDGALHVEYDIYLKGGVSSDYIKSAALLYESLLARLDEFVKTAPEASAPAPTTSGKASELEGLAAQGKYAEALAALDDMAAALWDKAPLTFRRALWVVAPPEGFGAYNPRENSVFASGAKMIAYVEPIGFGWQKSGELWRTDLSVDLVVKSKDGTELLRREDFQSLRIGSRVRNREFMANLTYTFSGIPRGDYVAETTLRDKVSGKSGTFSLPFTIR